jgi:hypothetical protein
MRRAYLLICWFAGGLLLADLGDSTSRAGAQALDDTPCNRPFRQRPTEGIHAAPFSLRKQDGTWWLLTPDRRRFFALGVCCVDRGTSADRYDAENPSYAAERHYPHAAAWADKTLRRLQEWRFNTIDGWSDLPVLRQSPEMNLAFMPVLSLGATAGAPWWDMWSDKVLSRMDSLAKEQILPIRDDPRLLGYYSDNELGWWNSALFKMTLEQDRKSVQRQKLLKLLHAEYEGDWQKLTADFEPLGAGSFEELERGGLLYLRAGGDGIRVMRAFLGIVAERYYAVCRELIRKYDQRAMILGDRYQSFYYPEVARAAARHVDAVSANLNTGWGDGSFVRFYLDTLHALTGKPVMVSEFYVAAAENRTGNRNSHGYFPLVATQAQRAESFGKTLHNVGRLPYVIGASWFQYYDEPPMGRFDGEDYNMGLVDVQDQPYEELVQRAASSNLASLRPTTPRRQDLALRGAPRASGDPMAHFNRREALLHWDRERGFVPPASANPLADLYVCWDPEFLYLGLCGLDPVETTYYADGRIPEIDRMEWRVSWDDSSQAVQVRLGSGGDPSGASADVTVASVSGVWLTVRTSAAMRIPCRRLGRRSFRAGDRIRIRSTLQTHARAYRMAWDQQITLADPLLDR